MSLVVYFCFESIPACQLLSFDITLISMSNLRVLCPENAKLVIEFPTCQQPRKILQCLKSFHLDNDSFALCSNKHP